MTLKDMEDVLEIREALDVFVYLTAFDITCSMTNESHFLSVITVVSTGS